MKVVEVVSHPLPPLDERAGPAAPLPAADARRLVAQVLARRGVRSDVTVPLPLPAPPRGRRVWWPWAAATSLLLSASVGAAAILMGWHGDPAPAPRVVVPLPPRPEPVAPIEVAEPAPEPAPPLAPVLAPAPPRDRLAVANRLRGQKRWRAAASAYDVIARDHAKGHAAEREAALVAGAALQREHLANPRAAIARFERALALNPSGPLAEEARWGLAVAWRSVGRPARERRALQELLQHHPESLRAPAAQARLQELAAAGTGRPPQP